MELTKDIKLEDIGYKLQLEDFDGGNMMFYDVDRLIEKGPNYMTDWIVFLDLWIWKNEPLSEQTDDCIDLVFNTLCPEWLEEDRDIQI